MPSPRMGSIRVLSYNVHHCNPPARPGVIDVEAIAQVIARQDPDVVALQEVDVLTARSGHIHQAQLLADLTGMHCYFAKAIDYQGGEFGNVTLSKYPMLERQVWALPSKIEGEPRVLSAVHLQTPEGFAFWFANTHLDSLHEETNRLEQIAFICRKLGSQTQPVILAGDFNASPGERTIDAFDQTFTRAQPNAGEEFTFPAHEPTKTIDFIAYRPQKAFRILLHRVVLETEASDHRPVLGVFEFEVG